MDAAPDSWLDSLNAQQRVAATFGFPQQLPLTDLIQLVRDNFRRKIPPVDEKLPGVKGVPSAIKKRRRGPSALNNSTLLEELKAFGNGPTGFGGGPKGLPAGVAATLRALAVVQCPCA